MGAPGLCAGGAGGRELTGGGGGGRSPADDAGRGGGGGEITVAAVAAFFSSRSRCTSAADFTIFEMSGRGGKGCFLVSFPSPSAAFSSSPFPAASVAASPALPAPENSLIKSSAQIVAIVLEALFTSKPRFLSREISSLFSMLSCFESS